MKWNGLLSVVALLAAAFVTFTAARLALRNTGKTRVALFLGALLWFGLCVFGFVMLIQSGF